MPPLLPKDVEPLDMLTEMRRLRLAAIERERLAAYGLEEMPLPAFDEAKAAAILNSEPLQYIPLPQGSCEWRRPGIRRIPQKRRI